MSNWTQSGYDPSEHKFRKGEIDIEPNGGYPQNYFYVDTIRSIVIGFGNFFNDLYVIRYDENGEPIKRIQVPVKFGPRMKSHDFRVEQESGKKYYIPLPNITYRIDSWNFAAERYAGGGEPRNFYSNFFEKNGVDYILTNKFWQDIQPVPYNISISMEAKTEHVSDAYQIAEQILTRFAPESYFDLKEFWFLNLRRSIKLRCESSNIEINTDFGEEDKREVTVSFTFTAEAFFYKPIQDSHIIDKIVTQLNSTNTATTNILEGNYNPYDEDGNYNRNMLLVKRHNFSENFGTKIGYVSALKPFEEQPPIQTDNEKIIQTYEYEETTDVTNYPTGSKILTAMCTYKDTDKTIWNNYRWLEALSATNPSVHWVDDTKGGLVTGWNKTYWSVTGDSLDVTGIKEDGKKIYQIYYNPKYIAEPKEYNTEGELISDTKYGGTIIKEYDNIFGYGDFNDNSLQFNTKNADLGTVIVPDAPVVSKSL